MSGSASALFVVDCHRSMVLWLFSDLRPTISGLCCLGAEEGFKSVSCAKRSDNQCNLDTSLRIFQSAADGVQVRLTPNTKRLRERFFFVDKKIKQRNACQEDRCVRGENADRFTGSSRLLPQGPPSAVCKRSRFGVSWADRPRATQRNATQRTYGIVLVNFKDKA